MAANNYFNAQGFQNDSSTPRFNGLWKDQKVLHNNDEIKEQSI